MDYIAIFLAQRTPRRAIALIAFLVVLYLFRSLALLLVFFVTFERALGWSAAMLAKRTGIKRTRCVLIILGIIVAALTAVIWMGVGKTVRTFTAMQQDFPERLAQLREHPLVQRVEDQFGGMEKIVEGARHYSGSAISAASAIGHFLIHIVMGFVLALVYVLEQEEIEAFWSKVDRRSLVGILGRWFKHVADATIVTVQLQLIVAACNTVMTLPVLLIIGVPNVGALMLLIFASALVPVIGNIVSGVTLSLLAYQQKGWLGVGLFVGLTFILHKIESYYLNPRLTSRHVKMPGFLLIVSLIACEHIFGFKGLFLSFPILFVAGRIRTDFYEEDSGSTSSPIDLSDSPDQLPSSKAMLDHKPALTALSRASSLPPPHDGRISRTSDLDDTTPSASPISASGVELDLSHAPKNQPSKEAMSEERPVEESSSE